MKYKITKKLISYFLIVIMSFVFIMGASFIISFKNHTINLNMKSLEEKSQSIAEKLTEYTESGSKSGGYGAYLRSLDDIAGAAIWIVDSYGNDSDIAHGNNSVNNESIDKEAESIIPKIFQGRSTSASSRWGESITAGSPVYDDNGTVIAAVILHADVKGLDDGYTSVVRMLLICILAGMAVSVIIAYLFAMRFVRPLCIMEKNTNELVNGNYDVSNNIVQDDEIGSLADRIDILSLRLKEAKKEQENLEKMRQEFIASVSHELRTPVTVIRGSLEALCDGVITDEKSIKEYYSQMLKDSKHLQRLINDLLELTRLQNPDFKIQRDEMNLLDALEDSVRSIRRMADKKAVSLNYKKEIGYFVINGDYARLRQMFMIILDNAVKFSNDKGNIDIEVSGSDSGGCEVAITDYGRGMTRDEVKMIFEKFYRSCTKENDKGTGLGLAIAAEIAERHNIKISCSSEKGKFTTFLLKI